MTRPEGSDAVGTAQPVVTFSGMDHAALARRTRRWGWVQYARYRQAAEKPFFWTAFVTALGRRLAHGPKLRQEISEDIAPARDAN